MRISEFMSSLNFRESTRAVRAVQGKRQIKQTKKCLVLETTNKNACAGLKAKQGITDLLGFE